MDPWEGPSPAFPVGNQSGKLRLVSCQAWKVLPSSYEKQRITLKIATG